MRYRLFILSVFLFSITNIFCQEQPLKSLTKGNRFVYHFSAWNASGFPLEQYFDFYEEVVGDTIIQGKKYAKVFSTFNNSVRIERSDSNTVFLWNGTQEDIAHSSNYKTGDTVRWQSYLFTPNLFRVVSTTSSYSTAYLGEYLFINTEDAFHPRYPYPGIPRFYFSLSKKNLGILEIYYASSSSIRLSAAWTKRTYLEGATINGMVYGDTATAPLPYAGLPDTSIAASQIIEIPLNTKNMGRFGWTVSYDTTLINVLGVNGAIISDRSVGTLGMSFDSGIAKDSIVWIKIQAKNTSDTTSQINITPTYFNHSASAQGWRMQAKAGKLNLLRRVTGIITSDPQLALSDIIPHPNPASEELIFSVASSGKNSIYIKIINYLGTVFLENSGITEGIERIELNIASLPRGIYFLEVFIGNKRYFGRFIKS